MTGHQAFEVGRRCSISRSPEAGSPDDTLMAKRTMNTSPAAASTMVPKNR